MRERDLRLILLSAHDTSLAAILSALNLQSKSPVEFAAFLTIELWQRKDSSGKNKDDYYITWNYNGDPQNFNNFC